MRSHDKFACGLGRHHRARPDRHGRPKEPAQGLSALQEALQSDKSPTKVLSFNDFGLIIMTRKRVKQSLERTMCTPCDNCEGSGWVKSPTTVCYEILAEARRLSKHLEDVRHSTLRIHPTLQKPFATGNVKCSKSRTLPRQRRHHRRSARSSGSIRLRLCVERISGMKRKGGCPGRPSSFRGELLK
jgi:hypothetical protein